LRDRESKIESEFERFDEDNDKQWSFKEFSNWHLDFLKGELLKNKGCKAA